MRLRAACVNIRPLHGRGLGLGSVAVKQGGASIRRRGLELGWSLPSRGPLARVDVLTRLARAADDLGYSVVTISDHIVLPTRSSEPYPYDKTGAFPGGSQQAYLEPIPLAAWLLAATRRLRVAISVLVIPYRNPVVTAKQLATIDALSGGRLIVGAGVGWWREEFEALAAPPYAERGAVTDEYLQLMKTLWTADSPRFDGKYYRVGDITMLPRPGPEAPSADLDRRSYRAGAPPDGKAG